MTSRPKSLDKAVAETAQRLADELGNFKHIQSAAILAFDWLPPNYQRLFMAKAAGKDVVIPEPNEAMIREYVGRVVALLQALPAKSGRGSQASRPKEK